MARGIGRQLGQQIVTEGGRQHAREPLGHADLLDGGIAARHRLPDDGPERLFLGHQPRQPLPGLGQLGGGPAFQRLAA